MALSLWPRARLLDGEFPHISEDALARVPRSLALHAGILPYRVDAGELRVLVRDETPESALDEVRESTGLSVHATSVADARLRPRLLRAYGADGSSDRSERGDAPPATRAIDALHAHALDASASDIHLEPTAEGGRIRLRVDGVLRSGGTFDAHVYAQVVSRVKVLAEMDISERRRPQDGRYRLDHGGRSIDARVSSMPTIAGEKLVIRLLDLHARIPRLEDLGMEPELLARVRGAIGAAHGFVVVSGPTGSGKTTTLYAAIAERNVEGQHLCTVEDPVEARIPGVMQVQVNARAGLTFESALRGFLRQDPNLIMVGEMRDAETARVAVSAALSGALVATTLHASDAPRTIERLTELGIPRHALAAGLSGVLAQRLVRRLCHACRRPARAEMHECALLELEPGARVFEPRGCAACGESGYRGRIGLFEFAPIDDRVRASIARGAATDELAAACAQSGYIPMLRGAARVAAAGTTSVAEIRRVLADGVRA